MAKDLNKLTNDELVALNQSLMAQRDDLKLKQLAVKSELDMRVASDQATNILEGMTDVQRNALIAGATATGVSNGS